MIRTSFTNRTAERLSRLAALYEQGQVSSAMEQALSKMLAQEAQEAHKQLAQIQHDLAEFERQYNLSTEEFLRRFETGNTDDRLDFVEWASLAQMAKNLEGRLKLLDVGESM